MMLLPKKIGPITLMRRLGSDGITESFAGILDEPAGEQVRVRRVLPSVLRDAATASAIETRVRDLATVRHPSVVPLIDLVADGDERFIVEQWVDGVDLAAILEACRRTGKRFPPNVYLHLATQICNALEALHGRPGAASGAENLLHLALAPDAVFVLGDGRLVVGNPGLVRSPAPFAGGGQAAPLEHLSPEQTQPDDALTPASDIFALGSLLYEMLLLEPLFRAESPLATLHKVRRAEVTAPLLQVKEVLTGLDKVLYRSLSLNPRHRYQRAFVLREDIRGLMAGYSFAGIDATCREFLAPLLVIGGAGGHERPSLVEESTDNLMFGRVATAPEDAPVPAVKLGDYGDNTSWIQNPGRPGDSPSTIVPSDDMDIDLDMDVEERESGGGYIQTGQPADHTGWVKIERPAAHPAAPAAHPAAPAAHPAAPAAHSAAPAAHSAAPAAAPAAVARPPARPDARGFEDDPVTERKPDPGTPAQLPSRPESSRPQAMPDLRKREEPEPPRKLADRVPAPAQAAQAPAAQAPAPASPAPRPAAPVDDDEPLETSGGGGSAVLLAVGVVVVLLALLVCAGAGGGGMIYGFLNRHPDAGQTVARGESPSVAAVTPSAGRQAPEEEEAEDAAPAPAEAAQKAAAAPSDPPRAAPSPATSSASTASAAPVVRGARDESPSRGSARPPASSDDAWSTPPTRAPEPRSSIIAFDPPPAAAPVEPVALVETTGDLAALSARATKGGLSSSDRSSLEAHGPESPDHTRALVVLYQDAKARGDDRARSEYITRIMKVPENRYNPQLLVEEAELYLRQKDYARALERAELAERHWARLPSDLVFSRKAMIFEVEALSWQGIFYESGGDDLDALYKAIRGWEKYRTHAETMSRADMASRAQKELTKLYDMQRRLE